MKLIKSFSSLLLFLLLLIFLVSPINAQGYAKLPELENVFAGVVSVVAIIGAFLSFLALIYAGFKFVTAAGDPKAMAAARSTLTWAIAGLAFIIFAWLILLFIYNFTGVNVTIFELEVFGN